MKTIAREAARRWGCDVDDAEQETRLVAWRKHQRGLPAKLVVRYTQQVMLSRESPLTPSPTSSLTEAEGLPRLGTFRSPLTNGQVRALARLTSSAFGGILARVEGGAPLRCPACGGAGCWGNRWDPTPAPKGKNAGACVENEREARERWPLYDAPRKARDDQVWWCRKCGGWTWDSDAKAREVSIDPDRLSVLLHGHALSESRDGEAELIRYVEAGRRRRRDDPDDDDE